MEELYERVNASLNEIRGFVKEDGGDVELIEITDERVAKVQLKGACTTCHMNNMTFKAGVEEAIMKAVPEIVRVEAINFDLHL